MSITNHLRTAVAIGVFSLVAVSPALAQGNGNANRKGNGNAQDRATAAQQTRQRPTLERRTNSDDDRRVDRRDERYDERYDDRRDVRRNVPPGWCIGRGNPHNTPENCGYSSRDRRDSRSDDRYDDRRYDGYGSYAEAHSVFHRQLDRRYADLAARRRSDPIYQIRLRSEKATEHQRWHERTGTRH